MAVPANFDALRYLASNPDLAVAFGTDQEAAYGHYLAYGQAEGRSTTAFDPLLYLASNIDLANVLGVSQTQALLHYIRYGRAEGRNTSSFNALNYIAGYSDLSSAFGVNQSAAAQHYLTNGRYEGRSANAFNALAYLASNSDLIAAFGANQTAATSHFIQYGRLEGRPIASFNVNAYMTLNPDVESAFSGNSAQAYQHYLSFGYLENRPTSARDFAGNTLAAARNIGSLGASSSSYYDTVSSDDTDDYYQFTLLNNGNLSIGLRNLIANANVQLLNASGAVIQSSSTSGSANESINAYGLTAGAYAIRVYSADGGVTGYRLNIAATATAATSSDGAGDTLASARNVGALGATAATFTDYVGTEDRNDYYRFTTSGVSNFQLSMTGMSADADVALLDANGNAFATSTYAGSSNEAIYFSGLGAGTYYVRVYPFIGSTNYSLSMSASPAATGSSSDQGGNTFSTASYIGTLGSSTVRIQDFVGTADRNDYYRFTTNGRSDFQLSMTGLSADADVRLLSSTGATLASSTRIWSFSESIRYNSLAAGTYYVNVYQYSGDTEYSLALQAAGSSGVNEAPVLNSSIANQTATEGSAFSYQVLSSLFTDPEGSALTYSATQANGSALPSWLSFNSATRTFSGTPTAGSDDVAVRLTARDPAGNTTSTNFSISTPSSSQSDSWTVMVYINGDNNLEAAALDDINEMEALNLPANVNVVVQVDRTSGYSSLDNNWTDTRRGQISQDFNTGRIGSTLTSVGELDMGDGATLTDFINWSVQNYRATNYALVVWDHGGGLSGTSWDDSSNSNLTVAETTRAIVSSTIGRVDLLGFDTCQQGMIEQAVDVQNLCDVLVASQENEPGDGWDYTNWLSTLVSNPSASETTLARSAVTSYGAFYNNNESTLAATETADYAAVTTALSSFVSSVLQGATTSDWTAINSARSQAHSFGDNDTYRDLGGFMNAIASSSASQQIRSNASSVATALSNSVLENVNVTGASGLSIYLPSASSSIRSDYTSTNFSFLSQVNWNGFLTAYQASV